MGKDASSSLWGLGGWGGAVGKQCKGAIQAGEGASQPDFTPGKAISPQVLALGKGDNPQGGNVGKGDEGRKRLAKVP